MATATKTRTRSPFQAADDFGQVLVTRSAIAPAEDDKGYADTRYTEFVNAERTIAVISNYRDYNLALRTTLTPEQVLDAESQYLTQDGYADTRARGVWVLIDTGRYSGISSKTAARKQAEALLAQIQDVNDPTTVSLDGKFGPALTIALKKVEQASEYRQDEERTSAVGDIAKEAGVNALLLAQAIKEDRLVWSTPPVAPAQVLVVVKDSTTGVLSERLVDEIVLATQEVEGLGRIVHKGNVTEYLLVRRERQQKASISAILTAREAVNERLNNVKQRTETLLEEVANGQRVGSGFRDHLRLAEEVEYAQNAATIYNAAILASDLPQAFLEALLRDEYSEDKDERYRYVNSDIRSACKALAALNGMSLDRDDY